MDETDFVIRFHALFLLAAAYSLKDCLEQTHFPSIDRVGGTDECADTGNLVILLVVFWHLNVFFRGLLQYPRILSFYRFLLPLSIWVVFADWFLVQFAQTLVFPRNGAAWMIGDAVTPAMAGMWSIPGLLILYTCYPSQGSTTSTTTSTTSTTSIPAASYIQASVVGLAIFFLAEQLLPFIWKPTDRVITRVGWGEHGVAVYVLPAEFLLGAMILYWYHATKESKTWVQPAMGAGMTMLMYTGALAIGLLIWESPHITI